MVTALARIFLKDVKMNDSQGRKAYGTLCSVVGIFFNICLFVGKYFAGVLTGAISITADAFNNLSDAGSSIITLVGFWFAGKKPDTEHPFGHGRFEYVSGMAVSCLIILMGLELAKSSVDKIIHPQELESSILAITILLISICVKLYMAFYNTGIGKKIDSVTMKATAIDSLSDSVATTVVLICVLVNMKFGINIDGICGLLVAILIIYAGIGAFKDTISPLLGKIPEPELVDKIRDIVMKHELVYGIHDLVVHDYGPGRMMISLHTEVPGNENVYKLHDMIDNIESELQEKIGCEAVIHMDPIEVDNQVVTDTRSKVENIVKSIDEHMSIHDFRMITGDTHTNLIFDVVVPFCVEKKHDEIKNNIEEKISELDDKYRVVMKIEEDYIGN
ncbi:cation diffusion facilitator family transporter [Eubacterium sp. AF19-12LB]|uniref:cation diffusion facilitator family transporter n=1 Tax=Eubacterium sp. AF19-12LB TaxID=2293106 RepID=UPI000E499D67|nr:cation diffusion facilitator family transporter [Eubacterium sp. AF19-12LB]RHR34644.1 cation transporter [Eubacterium sp. AF19-12LB]